LTFQARLAPSLTGFGLLFDSGIELPLQVITDDGTWTTIRSLTETEPPLFVPNTVHLCLTNAREFAKSKVSFPCFLLAPLLLTVASVESLSAPLLSLLDEFQDMMPDSLLDGLPPIRGIEHRIYLILGASLPNRAAYRGSPTECQEL